MAVSTSTFDAVIDRLASTPPERRRAAFLAELAALDPETSRDRFDLSRFVPKRFPECRGPWRFDEWNILVGIVDPSARQPTADEAERAATAAAAIAELHARGQALRTALGAHAAAKRKHAPKGMPLATPDGRAAVHAAAEELAIARERYEEAQEMEIRSRPHQPERKQASARNWLRALTARVTR